MKMLTYQEAADQYRCSKKTLERAVKRGDIDAYRPGKLVLLDEATVKAWFLSKQVRPVRRTGAPRKTRPIVHLRG